MNKFNDKSNMSPETSFVGKSTNPRFEIMAKLNELASKHDSEIYISCLKEMLESVRIHSDQSVSPSIIKRPDISRQFDAGVQFGNKVDQTSQINTSSKPMRDIDKRNKWQDEMLKKYCDGLIQDIKNLSDDQHIELMLFKGDFGKQDFGPKGKVYRQGTNQVLYSWCGDIKYSAVWFFNSLKKSNNLDKMGYKVEVLDDTPGSEFAAKVIICNDPNKFKNDSNVAIPEVEKEDTSSTQTRTVLKPSSDENDGGPHFS